MNKKNKYQKTAHQDVEKHLLVNNRRIFMNKNLAITPAKPQAATQANTPSFRPRPSYPLALIVERVSLGTCKCLNKRKKMRSWPVLILKR